MFKIIPALTAALLIGSASPAQPSSNPIEGAGPVGLLFVIDPDFVGLVIESPMANYGVTSDLNLPAGNHGVPDFQDYRDLRAQISAAINPDIDGIEAAMGSHFAFTPEARCRYDEGSESIFKRDGQWMVSFDIEFVCSQPARLKDVSVNLFDLGGFSTGSATVINGDAESTVAVNGVQRKVDFW